MARSTEAAGTAPFHHIFVATDFSAGAAQAIARAARLPIAERGKITVVHVLLDRIPKKARTDAEKVARRNLDQARKSLVKAAATMGRRDIKVTTELCSGQPYVEIVRHARAVTADLIVLGRHGRRPVRDMLIGSTAERVIRAGDLPVAAKVGVHRAVIEADNPRVAEFPFEPEHRFAATLHRAGEMLHVALKGAGERVLPMCSRMATLAGDLPVDASQLEEQANALAESGFRVLAIATGPVDLGGKERISFEPEHLKDLVFLDSVGMIDPLRPEAKESVRTCQTAGIQVAMVTGDHPVTALAIARELGFRTARSGRDRAEAGEGGVPRRPNRRLSHPQGMRLRVEPRQKLQIAQSLIRLGHFVAVTGNGANDAPALRAAHIGVALGRRGTDVERESAELILTDDNFASVVAGVEEGHIAYGNARKVVFLLVSSGAAELLIFVLTTAAGLPIPL